MRLAVSRKSDLAVQLLGQLNADGSPVSGRTLADQVGSSAGFVSQIMTPLVRVGWVSSIMGPSGGYSLGVALTDISVREVIEAIEGPTDLGICVLTSSHCDSEKPCALHGSWSRARTVLLDHLGSVTVADALGL